jgi:cytochrome P450
MAAVAEVPGVDLLDPSLYRHGMPHDLYSQLREIGPVLWHPRTYVPTFGSDVEFWAVIGHAEVEQANRDWETFSAYDGTTIVPFPPKRRGVMLVAKDPPEHLKLRKLISAGFTPRMIGRLEEQIVGRTERILDDAEARGEVDFVPEIAYQLPMHVIADIVGIPEPDRPEVFRLTEIIMQAADPELGITPAARRDAEAGLFGYAHQLSVDKRANPTDDVWSILACGELDQFELDMFFMVLTLAGSETTRNALTQGLMALLDNPDQLDDLRKDPSLMPTAAEEMLRWASPAICFARTVTRDTELGGQHLRSGDRVGLFYPSANRDEKAFPNASRFDIRRSPNPHVAFGGGGPHFCMGASLARCEVNVMTEALLHRFGTIEITGAATWMSAGPAATVGVAVQSLPVRLDRI